MFDALLVKFQLDQSNQIKHLHQAGVRTHLLSVAAAGFAFRRIDGHLKFGHGRESENHHL